MGFDNEPLRRTKSGSPTMIPQGLFPLVPTPAATLVLAANGVLEHLVDWLQWRIFPDGSHSRLVHGIACGVLLLAAILLRRVVTDIIFRRLKRLSKTTSTTWDDRLYPALEGPVAALILVVGVYAALTVLKLPPSLDVVLRHGAALAVLAIVFWGLLRAGGAVLSSLEEVAHARQIGIAHFMPLIKKTLGTLVVVFGVLMAVKSVGVDVGAVLAGLGIGGLAIAIAAQDTIANLFGSFVVVIDRPFKLGEFVRIGSYLGLVEDIGMRSTRLRSLDKSLVVIPNKTVAAEPVTNLSRFIQRRVEQVIGLTYETSPEQMEAMVGEIRRIILDEPEVDPSSVMVYFRDYSASSLDIWVVYVVKDPDFPKHMALRQRINLAIMRAVATRGLSFAYPTQTLYFEGDIARRMAGITPAPRE